MKPCILLIEDDRDMRELVAGNLEHSGFDVQKADDGIKGQALALQYIPDLIVLDLMLPRVDGLTLCQRLRRDDRTAQIPILMLTALAGTKDKVTGFNSGADDYLTKPFSFTELLVRVQALIRRNSLNAEPTTLQYADLEMNLLSREVFRSKHLLQLQPREFSLLEYFLRYPGRVLSKTFILEHVWDYDFDPQTNVVDVLVSRLRSKVDRDFDTKLIHTLRGVGYVLKL